LKNKIKIKDKVLTAFKGDLIFAILMPAENSFQWYLYAKNLIPTDIKASTIQAAALKLKIKFQEVNFDV
jgi:hypothetical protein